MHGLTRWNLQGRHHQALSDVLLHFALCIRQFLTFNGWEGCACSACCNSRDARHARHPAHSTRNLQSVDAGQMEEPVCKNMRRAIPALVSSLMRARDLSGQTVLEMLPSARCPRGKLTTANTLRGRQVAVQCPVSGGCPVNWRCSIRGAGCAMREGRDLLYADRRASASRLA